MKDEWRIMLLHIDSHIMKSSNSLRFLIAALFVAGLALAYNSISYIGSNLNRSILSLMSGRSQLASLEGTGSGLVGWWKFDEGSGATAADSSGNTNTGTLSGSTLPTWGTGPLAGDLSFDGSTSYVNVPTSSSLNIAGNLSVGAWVKINSFKDYGVIIEKGSGGTAATMNYAIWTYANRAISFYIADGINSQFLTYTAPVGFEGSWHHITGTVDGSKVHLYVDGSEKSSFFQTVTPAGNSYPVSISIPSYVLNGQIDDVRIYNRALSSAEVSALYAEATPPTTSDMPLIGYAWSSNVGWISFNCSDRSICGQSSYAVKVGRYSGDNTIGTLYGYAWSPSVGWIKFLGQDILSTDGDGTKHWGFKDPSMIMPDSTSITTSFTKIALPTNATPGNISGWARACSGTQSGNCSSSASQTDGWDGWIQLVGNYHLSPDQSGHGGVTIDPVTGNLSGYAWGGPVLGWINFSPNTGLGITPVRCPGCAGLSQSITLQCNAPTGTSPVLPTGSPATNYTLPAIASASGGSGGYTYSWSIDGTGATTYYQTTDANTSIGYPINESKTYDVGVSATDSMGNYSVYKSCGQVTVNSPTATPSGELNLYLAPASATVNLADASQDTLFVHDTAPKALNVWKGNPFKLAWINTLSPIYDGTTVKTGYQCNTTSDSTWSGSFNASALNTTQTVSLPSNAPTGIYTFNASCDWYENKVLKTHNAISNTTYLRIYTSSQLEY